jgi:hypothetical protein
MSTSAVIVVGHGCGRDVGDPSGWTECWLGLGVGPENPEPTRRGLKRHNTMSADGGTSRLAGQTSDLASCAIFSTGMWWWQGNAGFAKQGITGWSGGNTKAGGQR